MGDAREFDYSWVPAESASSTRLHGLLAALLLCGARKRALDIALLKAIDVVICGGNLLHSC